MQLDSVISWLVTNLSPCKAIGVYLAGLLKLVVMHVHTAMQLRRLYEHITKHPVIMLLAAASLVQ